MTDDRERDDDLPENVVRIPESWLRGPSWTLPPDPDEGVEPDPQKMTIHRYWNAVPGEPIRASVILVVATRDGRWRVLEHHSDPPPWPFPDVGATVATADLLELHPDSITVVDLDDGPIPPAHIVAALPADEECAERYLTFDPNDLDVDLPYDAYSEFPGTPVIVNHVRYATFVVGSGVRWLPCDVDAYDRGGAAQPVLRKVASVSCVQEDNMNAGFYSWWVGRVDDLIAFVVEREDGAEEDLELEEVGNRQLAEVVAELTGLIEFDAPCLAFEQAFRDSAPQLDCVGSDVDPDGSSTLSISVRIDFDSVWPPLDATRSRRRVTARGR